MKILVACEESQAVTKAFRKIGYDAWSCDVDDCSGGRPEWHIRDDVSNIMYFFPVESDMTALARRIEKEVR